MRVNWIGGDVICEILVRNELGEKVEHDKFNRNDIKRKSLILKKLKEKYDIDLTPKDIFDF